MRHSAGQESRLRHKSSPVPSLEGTHAFGFPEQITHLCHLSAAPRLKKLSSSYTQLPPFDIHHDLRFVAQERAAQGGRWTAWPNRVPWRSRSWRQSPRRLKPAIGRSSDRGKDEPNGSRCHCPRQLGQASDVTQVRQGDLLPGQHGWGPQPRVQDMQDGGGYGAMDRGRGRKVLICELQSQGQGGESGGGDAPSHSTRFRFNKTIWPRSTRRS